jgi:hypothetical protein
MSGSVGPFSVTAVAERPSVRRSLSPPGAFTGQVTVDNSTASLSLRSPTGDVQRSSIAGVSESALFGAAPWRTFRWYKGQRHYPGSYWAATVAALVSYESRLELMSLLVADFDRDVVDVVAQPFLLQAVVNGRVRRHVPDFLWRTTTGVVVVDVVRARRLREEPAVVELCTWTQKVVSSAGWGYAVFSEQPADLMRNLRFLSGYRRRRYISREALQEIRSRHHELVGQRIDDSLSMLRQVRPQPVLRSALLHALWTQEFVVELEIPLSPYTVLGAAR